ncbi:MAG: hypothetical protein KGK07_15635 [Chloroflexota bacterium]|nr:hypothetical protein [Chloroflexota bacterium]
MDDHFDEHPKMAKVGPIGWGVWLAGLAYCNRNLTDGFIPHSVAESIGGRWRVWGMGDDGKERVTQIARTTGLRGEDMDTDWVIELLMEADLWEAVEGGYRVHKYADYQPTRSEVEAERAQTLERVQRFRQKGSGTRKIVGNSDVTALHGSYAAVSNAGVTPAPNPNPNPNPNPKEKGQGIPPSADDRLPPPVPDTPTSEVPAPAPDAPPPDLGSEAQALATAAYDALKAAGRRPSDQRWVGRAIGRIKQLTPEARAEFLAMIDWALLPATPTYVAAWLSKCNFGQALDAYGLPMAPSARASPSSEPRGFAGIREFDAMMRSGGGGP